METGPEGCFATFYRMFFGMVILVAVVIVLAVILL